MRQEAENSPPCYCPGCGLMADRVLQVKEEGSDTIADVVHLICENCMAVFFVKETAFKSGDDLFGSL